jgi:hypothetical protein
LFLGPERMNVMPIGICKLCLQSKQLQDSHLVPRAMYNYVRTPTQRNPNPVVVGRNITATTSKQVSDYVLCSDCEQLFNRNGENWMLRPALRFRPPNPTALAAAVRHLAPSPSSSQTPIPQPQGLASDRSADALRHPKPEPPQNLSHPKPELRSRTGALNGQQSLRLDLGRP